MIDWPSDLMAAWVGSRGLADPEMTVERRPGSGETDATLIDLEVLRPGRPGLVDLVATVDSRLAHAVVGIREVDGERHVLRGNPEDSLGPIVDDHGPGVAVDALFDAELAPLVLEAIIGSPAPPDGVVVVRHDDQASILAFGGRLQLTVFPWLSEGPHPGIEMLVALDEVGFNHLAAPVAIWRRGRHDLGVVQDLLAGATDGRAMALTSLRDLFSSGGPPETAGGDFASEARALGTMTARLHLALDRAFGHHGQGPVVMRTHGDLHLGRMARTDHGWVVTDFVSGGVPTDEATGAGGGVLVERSPLADVAELFWSLRQVAQSAANERDPSSRSEALSLGRAWEERSRSAFWSGYSDVPGIETLVVGDNDAVSDLVDALEESRSTERPGTR